MAAVDGVNSTNLTETSVVATPAMLRPLNWSVSAAEACFRPSLNDAVS